ncbi:hypothetical protein ACQKWADRAFT_319316 [Trichoderma austrokoningii]
MIGIQPPRRKVAVIGLGSMGSVAVKNLLEEGFDVTGFERSGYIGGLWHFTENEDTLSVLECGKLKLTLLYCSKGTPIYCGAKGVEDYLEAYASHFNLRPHFRLSTTVTSISRDGRGEGSWRLDFEGRPSEWFDRVVMAIGPHVIPVMPKFEGADLFTGRLIHSKNFKKFSKMPSLVDGVSIGDVISYRSLYLENVASKLFPKVSERLFNECIHQISRDAFGELDPSWGLDPNHPVKTANLVISDTLIANFRSKAVKPIAGVRRFIGGRKIELTSAEVVEADTVICCTGYNNDFSLLEEQFDPAFNPSPRWVKAPGSKNRPCPRLYQNVFSLKAPDSLAFMGCVFFLNGTFCIADIASMCIAQVWSGRASLPPARKMQRWMDRHENMVCSLAQSGPVLPASVPQPAWLAWADQTAGLGAAEHLGWGWKGWLFWWRERRLWRMVMDGPMTAAFWRLFPGRRKSWDGAKAEIVRINEEVERKREQTWEKRLRESSSTC